MHKEEHCQRGLTNPLDEQPETFPECCGCGKLLYDEEAIVGDDGEKYCGECIAKGFEQTLKGFLVLFAYNVADGTHQFTVIKEQ